MLKPATVKHIKAFFQSPTNDDSFVNWNKAVKCLKAEPGTAYAWFCFWAYQNIQVLDANNEYWLSPGDFSFSKGGVRRVSVRAELLGRWTIFDLPLSRAEIWLADPAELYRKLGIEL
jgi:hypothetical protein